MSVTREHSPRSMKIAGRLWEELAVAMVKDTLRRVDNRGIPDPVNCRAALLSIVAALDAEREACARVADAHDEVEETALIIADEIRALGEQP